MGWWYEGWGGGVGCGVWAGHVGGEVGGVAGEEVEWGVGRGGEIVRGV